MRNERDVVAMLRSPKASMRYEACELLRVAPHVTPQAIEALEIATGDPSPEVAERAASALIVHLRPVNSPPAAGIRKSVTGLAPRRGPPPADKYFVAILPALIIVGPLSLLLVITPFRAFLIPGHEYGYSVTSLDGALCNLAVLATPYLAGLIICRVVGWKLAAVASLVLGLFCWCWFFLVLWIAGG